MNNIQFFTYLAIMAITTYLIRAIPFSVVKGKIKNRFFRSFLYYIPYAVLTAMTIPAIFYATSSPISAAIGFAVAFLFAFLKKDLTFVACAACISVFIAEMVMEKCLHLL